MPAGYKEWSLVCEALGAGAQSILLRRGGIAEGKDGFAFRHERFLLLPTRFHQQGDHVRWDTRGEEVRTDTGDWIVRYAAEVARQTVLRDWDLVRQLQPFHVWKEDLVRERFEYKSQALIHAALVRIHRLSEPLSIPETEELGGCRSWVENLSWNWVHDPVLDDAAFQKMENATMEIWK